MTVPEANVLANVLSLRDMIEHLCACQKQLEWADDHDTISLLTETMQRDLERCQRLCSALHRRTTRRQVST